MVDLPDESGLSIDSLRGSANLIRVDLIDAKGRTDSYTGKELTRGPLTQHELTALHGAGVLVADNGEMLSRDAILETKTIPPIYRESARLQSAPPVTGAVPSAPPPGMVYVDGAYMHVEDYYRVRRESENRTAASEGLTVPGHSQGMIRPGAVRENIPTVEAGNPATAPASDIRPFGAPNPENSTPSDQDTDVRPSGEPENTDVG